MVDFVDCLLTAKCSMGHLQCILAHLLQALDKIRKQHSCCMMSTWSMLLCGLARRKTTFAELLV